MDLEQGAVVEFENPYGYDILKGEVQERQAHGFVTLCITEGPRTGKMITVHAEDLLS